MTIDELKADFDLLDDWEDRYRYVIELGKGLAPLPDVERTDANKVRGCASQVWISQRLTQSARGPVLHFTGDSDALIVKGLIAIAFMIFSDRSAEEILERDAEKVFASLGLREHLTPQRSNGLASMVARIKTDARAALSGQDRTIPGR
jgi:cysteine desulfuration protein SufE